MTGELRHPPAAGYQSYLIRLWQEHPAGPWRALARDAQTGEAIRFATLEQLFRFLHERTAGASDAEGN